MSTDRTSDAILDELRALARRMSPSAIPEVRGRAAHQRESRRDEYSKPYPVYGPDSLCDYLEAVFAVVEVGGCGNGDGFDWSIYDERRRGEHDQRCCLSGCNLAVEYPQDRPSTCIRHREVTATESDSSSSGASEADTPDLIGPDEVGG